jgi:integrase
MSLSSRQRGYRRGRVYRRRRPDGTEYGSYLIAYYVGGKEQKESAKTPDPQVATRLLNERMGSVATGQAPPAGAHRVTIAELLADRLALFEVEQRPSLQTEQGHIAVLTAALGPVRAVALTERMLQRFVADRRTAGDADATINRRLASLHSALRRGQKAKPPRVTTIPPFPHLDESGNVRQGFATVAQAETIFATLRARDADLADAVEWKFWTGMRKGAIARLGWEQWDYETEMLRLPPPGRKKRTPKAIPLRQGHPLRAIIDRRWARRKARAKETGSLEPLIFWRLYRGAPRPGLRPGDAVAVYQYRKAFARAAAAAGVPGLVPHDLRRTACRNAWQATLDRRVAMMLSGHATEAVFDRYNIDTGEQLADALDKIAAFVDRQPKVAPPVVPQLPRRRRAAGRTS